MGGVLMSDGEVPWVLGLLGERYISVESEVEGSKRCESVVEQVFLSKARSVLRGASCCLRTSSRLTCKQSHSSRGDISVHMSLPDRADDRQKMYSSTAVDLCKIDSLVCPTHSAGGECPQSARDQRITSTMSPPYSPYDHTTPPTTPRLYAGTTPQSAYCAQTLGYTRSPEAAAVWQHGSHKEHTVPRGHGPRSALDYNKARDAHFKALHPIAYSVSPFLEAYAASFLPKMTQQQQRQQELQLQLPCAMMATEPREVFMLEATEHRPKKSKTKSASKTPEWLTGLTQKKRRPSDIFNKNFGFDVASLRGPADRTPQISPRTSISHAEPLSFPTSPTSSVKRQRVDSKSAADTTLGFPFGKPTPTKSMRGRDLGSLAMSPRGSIGVATELDSRPGRWCSMDVHPGTPVSWGSSPSVSDEEDMAYMSPDMCSASLTLEARRRSFPSISLPAERKHSNAGAIVDRLAALNTPTNPFDTSESCTSTSTSTSSSGRKRTCTLERRDCASRKTSSESTPSSATSIMSVQERTASTLSMPSVRALKWAKSDPSTEAFLKHIRASLERRRSKDAKEKGKDVVMEYPVFADEHEKGFLDDTPL